jgi:hypothetical protein
MVYLQKNALKMPIRESSFVLPSLVDILPAKPEITK